MNVTPNTVELSYRAAQFPNNRELKQLIHGPEGKFNDKKTKLFGGRTFLYAALIDLMYAELSLDSKSHPQCFSNGPEKERNKARCPLADKFQVCWYQCDFSGFVFSDYSLPRSHMT